MASIIVSLRYRLTQHQLKYIFIILVIEPEAEFVHVSLQILHRDMVVDSINSTLENSPEALYVVCVHKIFNKSFGECSLFFWIYLESSAGRD